MKIEENVFGTIDNQEISIITLTNHNGVSLKATPYGATLVEWNVPDKNGKIDNITLGLADLDSYVNVRPFYGATIGRVAGRINAGMFTLEGVDYQLEKNLNGHHLHGGLEGLDTKVWSYHTTMSDSEASIHFEYVDEEGSNGYPGTVTVQVVYTLTDADEWKLTYRAKTDQTTLFTPTNHVYFNLHGDVSRTILDHTLFVAANRYVALGEGTIPTGDQPEVTGTPFDFREAAPVQQILDMNHEQTKLVSGLDHPFVLAHDADGPDAILIDEESGRSITMKTDQPVVVIYTHNGPQAGVTIDGNEVGAYAGITLETQGYPDAINIEDFESITLHPGEEYFSETVFQFSLLKQI